MSDSVRPHRRRDPIDGSPPGSSVPGILQARILEWVAISYSNAWKWKVKGKSLSHVWLFATPWTAAHQAPLSMGFSRQEYWSRVPSPPPLDAYYKYSVISITSSFTMSCLGMYFKVSSMFVLFWINFMLLSNLVLLWQEKMVCSLVFVEISSVSYYYMWSFFLNDLYVLGKNTFSLFTGWRLCPHLLENMCWFSRSNFLHANNILSPGCIACNRSLLKSLTMFLYCSFFSL